uniref:ATPase AAA-type core domain-containing protein n=1 Tax=Setaria digitata TaxID=48799 RepID=A0A915Q0B2_9BILA
MPFLFRIQNYCGNLKTATISRVLPEILLKDVFLLELDILAVFRLNYSQSKSEVITVSSVSNFETGKTTYALLIELSITSSHFVELRNCLKQYDPRHCVISPRLYQFISGEYEWIKISPLPKHHICQLGTLEVLSEGNVPENFNECLRNHLWKTCQHYPIIVPIDGLKMEMNLTSGARMQCHIRPRQDERTDQKPQKCFIFTNDVFPSLEYSNNESKKDSSVKLQRTNVSEDVHQVVANFGEWKNEAIEFSFQIAFIERYYAYITYHLENSIFSSSDNIFIVGNKSVGKTTILHLLAEKLFRSHLAVYSEYLYCSDWSGKTIEKFQDALKASVTRLRRRYPSVLFLDNLDFLLHSQDEDMRNVRLERCAERKFANSKLRPYANQF